MKSDLIEAGKRRGYHVLDATADGSFVGEPRRTSNSVRPQDVPGKRYEGADCPFCEGPLVETPQCNGRAVTNAAPHELFLMDPLPATNMAVACLECMFAFYPLVDGR